MAKFSDFADGTFKCDKCKKPFKGGEIKLSPKIDNISMPMATVIAISSAGTIVRGAYDDLKDTDQIMACPHCKSAHIFGFDPVIEVESVAEIN